MGMIDRYKKRGGFIQLLNLIETTGHEKRDRFLKMIAEESPAWEATIKQKVLTIDRICSWNTPTLMEFLSQVPVMAVAFSIYPLPEDKRAHVLSALPYGDRKKVEETLNDHTPNPGEIATSQIKLINEIRNLSNAGKIKFEKFDPDLAIPEDIEEKLSNGVIGVDLSSSDSSPNINVSAATAPHSASSPSSSATSSGPSVNSGGGSVTNEEATQLRRKIVSLTQENAKLAKENRDLVEKLEILKAAFKKVA